MVIDLIFVSQPWPMQRWQRIAIHNTGSSTSRVLTASTDTASTHTAVYQFGTATHTLFQMFPVQTTIGFHRTNGVQCTVHIKIGFSFMTLQSKGGFVERQSGGFCIDVQTQVLGFSFHHDTGPPPRTFVHVRHPSIFNTTGRDCGRCVLHNVRHVFFLLFLFQLFFGIGGTRRGRGHRAFHSIGPVVAAVVPPTTASNATGFIIQPSMVGSHGGHHVSVVRFRRTFF